MRGPYGRFNSSPPGDAKQVWVAGGIGVTPFLSMIRAMQPGDPREVHFVYAARSRNEALFLDELVTRVEKTPNVTLHTLFSDEGEFARIDAARQRLPDSLTQYEYFMCGPRPMVAALMRGLRSEGVRRSQIHTEAFEFR
ncbi:MAG: hypothetical protein AAGE52_07660 [Myxococcota bacterium]